MSKSTIERAYATCLSMLEQRGYTVTEKLDKRIQAVKPSGEGMAVFFIDVDKFRSQCNKDHIAYMNALNIKHSIIVYNESVTAPTYKDIQHMKDLHIELFALDDLQYNITTHRLQPTFQRLSPEEAKRHKKQYGIKFPVLKKDDPIARFYDYTTGDVIRIVRYNGSYIAYRIVR